uniref:Uncharacterized protein n=1 Tax=Zea mays TaxID=4577 RepID=C4J017_MAIZE|nr:unknown [Zea mays]
MQPRLRIHETLGPKKKKRKPTKLTVSIAFTPTTWYYLPNFNCSLAVKEYPTYVLRPASISAKPHGHFAPAMPIHTAPGSSDCQYTQPQKQANISHTTLAATFLKGIWRPTPSPEPAGCRRSE